MSADDGTLVAQARTGDPAAFRELVLRHQRRVYAVAYGMLQSADDAMDARWVSPAELRELPTTKNTLKLLRQVGFLPPAE